MVKCRVCGRNLFENITFLNLFKINYEIHINCLDSLDFNEEKEVIPIESNIILYDYVFTYINTEYDMDYLWFNYFGEMFEKYINNEEWSIVIIPDKNFQEFMNKYNPFLLINLTSFPILVITLKKMYDLKFELI